MAVIAAAFAVLLIIVSVKKIPFVGGKVKPALLIAGLVVLLGFGYYRPLDWFNALWYGLDSFDWIIFNTFVILLFASYMERLDVIGKVVRILKAIFGSKRNALLISTFIALVIFGALVGATSATCMVVSVFFAKALYDQGLTGAEVSSVLAMGASIGSLCPPISMSFNYASAATGADISAMMPYGFLICPLVGILCCIYSVKFYGRKRPNAMLLLENEKREKVLDVLKEVGWSGMPIIFMLTVIILNNGFKINLIGMTVVPLLNASGLTELPILNGFTNVLMLTILVTCIICMIFYPECRKNNKENFALAYKRSVPNCAVFVCAGFLVGAVNITGGIDIISEWAMTLDGNALKIGGAVCICLMGMITGSNSTAVTTIAPFLTPALLAAGVDLTHIAVAIGILASAGQGMPPADNNTFIVTGMVSGLVGEDNIDNMEVMLKNWPMWTGYFVAAMIVLYL